MSVHRPPCRTERELHIAYKLWGEREDRGIYFDPTLVCSECNGVCAEAEPKFVIQQKIFCLADAAKSASMMSAELAALARTKKLELVPWAPETQRLFYYPARVAA